MSAVAVVGCESFSTEPDSAGAGQPANAELEAPPLAALVDGGELPPLEDRLPDEPVQVDPVDRLGSYGGTWRTALLGAADVPWLTRTIGYESLLRWNREWTGIEPNIAETFEQSEDGREFTIRLRRNIKWSDGEPCNADDLVFAWDVLLHRELYPVTPTYMTGREGPGSIEKVDNETVVVTFPVPNGLFEMHLAYLARELVLHPRHYLEQFHIDHNADAEEIAAAEGYATWHDLFLARSAVWENPDLPRLHPWVLAQRLDSGGRVVARRNPYYFKVDPDGRQLPYIDEVTFSVVSDEEVMLLMAANGEMDFHTRHFNTLPNKPILADSRESGDYRFTGLLPSFENEMVIGLNLSHEDGALREVFQNRGFRVALSHAINRQEIIDTVFQWQGTPWQVAPRPESDFYDEEFATQYLDYDPGRATEILDAEGFTPGPDGVRRGPTGEPISFSVEIAQPALVAGWPDAMELVRGYWQEVGINARIETLDRSLLWEHIENNSYDGTVWTGYGGLSYGILLEPGYYFPYSVFHAKYASSWGDWFSSRGRAGDEPPERTRRQMELYWELMETPAEEDRQRLLNEILQIAKEEFYVIGTVLSTEGYGIARNGFRNVPDQMPESQIFFTPAGTNPEQYFIQDS